MERKTKEVRELTVSSVGSYSTYGRRTSPMLRIQGQWLAACGFDIGASVKVKCENGRLIVTLRERQSGTQEKVG